MEGKRDIISTSHTSKDTFTAVMTLQTIAINHTKQGHTQTISTAQSEQL